MSRRRKPEQIINLLREAEVALSQGETIGFRRGRLVMVISLLAAIMPPLRGKSAYPNCSVFPNHLLENMILSNLPNRTKSPITTIRNSLGKRKSISDGRTVSVRPSSSTGQNRSLLRSFLSVTPGHQFVEPGDLVIGDAAEHIGEPGLGINAIQLGGFDQGVGDRR
jgi:hypothetical protein